MPYADAAYYTDTYKGNTIPTIELEKYLERASDNIDQLSYCRIQAYGFENVSDFQEGYIKKAVCCQADYLYSTKDLPENVSSYSINGTSMSFTDANKKVSSDAVMYLKATGFMYRGL